MWQKSRGGGGGPGRAGNRHVFVQYDHFHNPAYSSPLPPPPPATFFVYGPVAGHKCSIIKAKGLPSGYQASSDKPPRQKHLQSNLQADKPTNCQNRQTNKLEMKRKYIITNNNFGIHNFFLSTDISASFYISRVPPRPS